MTFMRQSALEGSTTPNIEKSEGVRVAQHFVGASYLPLVRFDAKMNEWKTISYGKVITVDANNDVVPAGLAIDIDIAKAGGYADKNAFIAAAASFGSVYTATDVAEGILNFQGKAVTAGEPVIASFFENYNAGNAQINQVGAPLGMMPFDLWRQNGAGWANNPMNYRLTNWNPQQGTTILTRYFIELPVVTNLSQIVYPGLTVFENGGSVKGGDIVTFTKHSNYTVLPDVADLSTSNTFSDAAINAAIKEINDAKKRALGKVYFVDTKFPKDFLNYVRTYKGNVSPAKDTDGTPGTATNGLPDNLRYAGVTDPAAAKLVRLNLIVV